MPNENNDEKINKRSGNIFEIMDEIIDQLNNTKRLFIIMILTIMIIPPIVFVISFELLGPHNPPSFEGNHHKNENREGFGGIMSSNSIFHVIRHIPLIIGLIWLGVGIRQWIVLSKWSKKYQKYKELQKKIDKKMDNNDDLG